MQPGGLVERLSLVPGMDQLGDVEQFDPGNDLHVDEAARLLLQRFRQANDVEAFTLLFELTHPRLQQIATQITRRLSPAADPDDLAAAFMARMFAEALPNEAAPVRRFLALAHSAMRNAVFDQLRAQKRATAGGALYQGTLRLPHDPAEIAQHHEEDEVLGRYGRRLVALTDECFHQLEERDKHVLVAREILGMSYERVAMLLQLEPSQVGMIIRRARQHLADRIVEALAGEQLDDAPMASAAALVRGCLESKERVKSVRTLVQRMLDAAAQVGHRRLADLVYEMAKACLLSVPEFEQRMLVDAAPRRREAVADDMRGLSDRLGRVSHPAQVDQVVELARHVEEREVALQDAYTCLDTLERLEGPSGRQQVAVALHHVHTGRLEEAETLLRRLIEMDLPERTRQNVFRNLTLTLLRRERWDDALEIAEIAGVEWPDDPVRIMNVCYATARLGDAQEFERHVRELVRLATRDPQPRLQAWIAGELPELAAALGLPEEALDNVIASARGGAEPGKTPR